MSDNRLPIGAMVLAFDELRGCLIRRPGPTCEVRKEFLTVALEVLGEAIGSASVDTHPKDGDALAAPLVSGAVGEAETPSTSHRSTGE